LYPRPPTALLFEGAEVVSAAVLDWKAHAPPPNLRRAAATHPDAVSVVAVPFPDPRFRDTESYDLPESSSLHFCTVCTAVGVGDCLSSTADSLHSEGMPMCDSGASHRDETVKTACYPMPARL
jgi:hypothetical protein